MLKRTGKIICDSKHFYLKTGKKWDRELVKFIICDREQVILFIVTEKDKTGPCDKEKVNY